MGKENPSVDVTSLLQRGFDYMPMGPSRKLVFGEESDLAGKSPILFGEFGKR